MWKDWEINGIRVHDVLFPKNPILKFMSKKKTKEFLIDEHMGFFFRHLLLECCLLTDFDFIAVEWISISRIREKT